MAAVGPAEHAAWLVAVPADKPALLYPHLPFCERLR